MASLPGCESLCYLGVGLFVTTWPCGLGNAAAAVMAKASRAASLSMGPLTKSLQPRFQALAIELPSLLADTMITGLGGTVAPLTQSG